MSDPAFQRMSVEEYLRTEPDSPVKREYVNGFVYVVDNGDGSRAHAGSSKAHARIISRIMRRVEPVAEELGCRAFSSEIRLKIEGRNSYYYPDVMVACDPESEDPYSETSPCILVEVLSRGTAHTDRHAKYEAYTALPTLQTYLIVAQDERRVYAYQRQGECWELAEYVGQGEIGLPCLAMTLSLDEMYAGVLEG
ncbi:Uma2 family endonuclease [Deinococcus aluminii]|uniref:Putative restriction endonuclease domain-containing protein n=1 Tax=Deinococcus aluminii TaxID=1656885 RepID=A0ABP9X8T1_9DEIO